MTASRHRSATRWSYVLGALGGGIRGYELGVIAGALLFITPALHLSPSLKGIVVGSALFGSMGGALLVGPVSDRFGRRAMVAVAAALYSISALGTALSPTVGTLIAFRIVLGVGVGIATAMAPVYISELAPARGRGSFSALFQLLIVIGGLAASIVTLVLSTYHAWRWMFGLALLPSIVMLAGVYFLPESPRWLIKHGREAEARAVLQRTRDQVELEAEIADIKSIDQHERQRLDVRTLLRSNRLRRLLLIGIGLGVLQQFTGTNTVTYYAPTILASLGYSKTVAIAVNLGLSVVGLIMTAVMVFFLIDNIGRKKPLIFGALGMTVSMLILGFASRGIHAGGLAGYIAIAGLTLFKISFTLSWGGIVWVMLSEMFPLKIRGTAMGIATFMTEGASVAVSVVFPILRTLGGAAVFFIFAGMGILAFLLAAFLLPETKQRSLEDIETDLTLGIRRHRPVMEPHRQ